MESDENDQVGLCLTSLDFSDGTNVQVTPNGVIVLVGPNNSGKSEAIRNIAQHIAGNTAAAKVVKAAEIKKTGSENDLLHWVATHCETGSDPQGQATVSRGSEAVRESDLKPAWKKLSGIGALSRLLTLHATTDQRLNLVKSNQSFDVRQATPTTPLQFLFTSVSAETALADAIRNAFGQGIVVDRFGGSKINLLFGEIEDEAATESPSDRYFDALRKLPTVNEQGDGIRSFAGLLVAMASGMYPITLIDEPEAFLHPPQAALLARNLASEAKDAQLVIATHSRDVVQGLLEARPSDVTLLRVTRTGDINPVSSLSAPDLEKLWSDPILRFSNILDGLFHDAVVICESDGDCRFYKAVLDETQKAQTGPRREVLFVPSGGKHRVPVIASALTAVGVPTAAVLDIDALREPDLVKRITKALNGKWDEQLEEKCKQLSKTIDNLPTETFVGGARTAIDAVFADADESSRLTRDQAKKVKSAVRLVDGWGRVKSAGAPAIPNGDATATFKEIDKALAQVGVHLVPVGEIEGFAPDIPKHGPGWAIAALDAGSHLKNPAAEAFVRRVCIPPAYRAEPEPT